MGCCAGAYTTRAYKLNGNTLWKSNYFGRIPYLTVVANGSRVKQQVADANYVYVGGQRVTDGTDFWSLVCFDIDTGALQWKRDLYNDILGTTADVVDIIDSGSDTYKPLYNGTLVMELWGQGGSPPDGGATQSDGAQSGGYCKKTLTVTAGQSLTYSIGLNGHNSNGGNTSVTLSPNTYTANGGSKTTSGAGTASGGDINTTGNAGSAGALDDGGAGGNAPGTGGGTGGAGGNSGSPGSDGNPPGGGGGGAGTFGGTSGIGGHGRIKFTLTPVNPIGYLGDVLQLNINSSGNIVAMLDPSNYAANPRVQHFVEVQPDSTLVGVYKFIQQKDPILTTQYVPTLGFTIDSADTFHVLASVNGTVAVEVFRCQAGYEFPSPYSTATLYEDRSTWGSTAHRSFESKHITRIGSRDFVGGNSYNGLIPPAYNCPGLLKGKSQTQSIRTFADIDKTIYPFPTLSSNTVFAAGSTQGTATALTAGDETGVVVTVSNQGVILPSGASAGDCCGVGINSGSNLRIYPPSGGKIIESDQFDRDNSVQTAHVEYSTNAYVLLTSSLNSYHDYFFCLGSDVWVRFAIRYQTASTYNQLVRWCPTVDSGNNIICVNASGELVKHTSSGLPTWWAGKTHIHSVCDSSDNIYSIGIRDLTKASIVKRNSSGVYQWGHVHGGDDKTAVKDCELTPSLIHFDSGGDSGAGAIIASGQIQSGSADLSFVSDPW